MKSDVAHFKHPCLILKSIFGYDKSIHKSTLPCEVLTRQDQRKMKEQKEKEKKDKSEANQAEKASKGKGRGRGKKKLDKVEDDGDCEEKESEQPVRKRLRPAKTQEYLPSATGDQVVPVPGPEEKPKAKGKAKAKSRASACGKGKAAEPEVSAPDESEAAVEDSAEATTRAPKGRAKAASKATAKAKREPKRKAKASKKGNDEKKDMEEDEVENPETPKKKLFQSDDDDEDDGDWLPKNPVKEEHLRIASAKTGELKPLQKILDDEVPAAHRRSQREKKEKKEKKEKIQSAASSCRDQEEEHDGEGRGSKRRRGKAAAKPPKLDLSPFAKKQQKQRQKRQKDVMHQQVQECKMVQGICVQHAKAVLGLPYEELKKYLKTTVEVKWQNIRLNAYFNRQACGVQTNLLKDKKGYTEVGYFGRGAAKDFNQNMAISFTCACLLVSWLFFQHAFILMTCFFHVVQVIVHIDPWVIAR